MKSLTKFSLWALGAVFAAGLAGVIALLVAWVVLGRDLPPVEQLKEVRLQVPLRIYSHDGRLIAEYGEKRRIPVHIEEVPPLMKQAFLAAEDDRFYEHPGVDWQGVLRAALNLALTGRKTQGASTITMQVAKNFFLSPEKTYTRKLREMFLALKIERELTKDQILELYLNKIYLGHRAYGVGAAAQVYYGTDIRNLTLPQIAMIAGLPKAPSGYNPIVNPERAWIRRNYVLDRMHELGYIDDPTWQQARKAPLTASLHGPRPEVEAPYLGEMVRREMVARFGERAYGDGLRVYTTLRAPLQAAANRAVRAGLVAYDRRHGWRGPEAHVDLSGLPDEAAWDDLLDKRPRVEGMRPALVLEVDDDKARLYLGDGERAVLELDGVRWARRHLDENRLGPEVKRVSRVLVPGDVVRVSRMKRSEALPRDRRGRKAEVPPEKDDEIWTLAQVPEVSGALVSLRPADGAVLALVGGFDYYLSKFNRVTQAQRQPGSSFKPFIYSAALEKGYTPASIINDAPVVFEDAALEDTWRPENYSGHFYGPTRLRVALMKSRNLVSIRLLRAIGIGYALKYVARFGFDTRRLPHDLSLALGSGTVTPLELARGYTVFANTGYRVDPWFIERIEDSEGKLLFEAEPKVACAGDCLAREGEGYLLELEPAEAAVQEMAAAGAQETAPAAGEPDAAPDAGAPSAEHGDGALTEPRRLPPAPRVIAEDNAWQIVSMMKDVIRHGTGRRALALGRHDLAGKTGTTNDQKDAWFSGYNPAIVTTVWVGFDRLKPLGSRETGAGAALPIWVDYMRVALQGVPELEPPMPADMVTVRIDPETGKLASAEADHAIFETFRARFVPKETAAPAVPSGGGGDNPASGGGEALPEQLF